MPDRRSQCNQSSQSSQYHPALAGSAGRTGLPAWSIPGCSVSHSGHASLPEDPPSAATPPLLSLQQEPTEAPTPKRPRGRPKGSKNKATPKGRVGGWGGGSVLSSIPDNSGQICPWEGGASALAPREGRGGSRRPRGSACGHP